MVNIIRGDIAKTVSSSSLADYFESRSDIEGNLYLGYPIIGTPQGGYQIDALLVSKEHGIVILDLLGNKLKKPRKPIWIMVSRILSQKP